MAVLLLLSALEFRIKIGGRSKYFGVNEGCMYAMDYNDGGQFDRRSGLSFHPPIFWHLPLIEPYSIKYCYPWGVAIPFWMPVALWVGWAYHRRRRSQPQAPESFSKSASP
jgi:hypothetical protein